MNCGILIVFIALSFSANFNVVQATGFSPICITIVEGGPAVTSTITVGAMITEAVVCTLKSDNSAISLSATLHTFTPSSTTKTLSFSAVKGTVPDDKDSITVKVTLQCATGLIFPLDETELKIIIKKEDSSAKEDPHLKQFISGIDETSAKVERNICYDLYGKSGDQFEIISDRILDSSVTLMLRDDFYIGAVFVQTPMGFINVTTSDVLIPHHKRYEWSTPENLSLKHRKDKSMEITVEIRKEYISIGIKRGDRDLNARLSKVEQSYGKSYLNVLVGHSNSKKQLLDEHHGGLFGEISNQQYKFYYPVQSDKTNTIVKINDRFVKSILKDGISNGKDSCYLMKLKDLLYPKSIEIFKRKLN